MDYKLAIRPAMDNPVNKKRKNNLKERLNGKRVSGDLAAIFVISKGCCDTEPLLARVVTLEGAYLTALLWPRGRRAKDASLRDNAWGG